jgi:hypothetical protein
MITNGSPANDPHQPPALIIVDLPHTHAGVHDWSLYTPVR